MQSSEPKDSNPYVAVVAKKHRNLKKKLERIAKAEQLLEQGKVLDEEQRILLSSKKAIEKSVIELFNIKQQLEEVAKQEESTKLTNNSSAVAAYEAKEQSDSPAQDAATATESAEQFVAATMTEEEEEEYVPPVPEVDIKEKFNEFIDRLIKALHVYERYSNVTNQPLPDTVVYFGRTLLGLTSISSFQDTLANSIRVAGFYLHDDLAATNDVIRGTSYAKLAAEIDVLVEEMERVQQRGTTNALTALLRTSIAPVSPVNTPAAVESVPAYDAGLYGSLQFGDQSLGSFNAFQYSSSAPVYQTSEPVYQPAVEIASTMPEFENAYSSEPVIDNGDEDEDDIVIHHGEEEQQLVEDEEEIAVGQDEIGDSNVADDGAEAPSDANAAGKNNRFMKNVRVRGDPSRAKRKEEDAKKHASRGAAHHHDASHETTASSQKTFRDRLLSGKATSEAHPAVATPPVPPASAPVSKSEDAPAVVTGEVSDGDKRNKRTSRNKEENAAEGSAPIDKSKKDRNNRSKRRSDGEATPSADSNAQANSEVAKKWASIAASTSGEAGAAGNVVSSAPVTAVAAGPDKKTPKTEKRPPRAAGEKADRPPRKEKKESGESHPAPATSASDSAGDGFQAVSRRTAQNTAAPATSASTGAKKEGGDKKKPAVGKKPITATAAPAPK